MPISMEQAKKVAGKPVAEVLRNLWHKHGGDEDPPYISIGNARFSATGWLVNADFSKQEVPLVLALPNHNGNISSEMFFCHGYGVEWLTVHHCEDLLPTLSDGKIDALDQAEPKGQLAISRLSQDISGKLSELLGKEVAVSVNWDSFESSDKVRVVVEDQLNTLRDCMLQICSDDFAKEAIAPRISSVVLHGSEARDLRLDGACLELHIGKDGASSARFSESDLKSSINKMF